MSPPPPTVQYPSCPPYSSYLLLVTNSRTYPPRLPTSVRCDRTAAAGQQHRPQTPPPPRAAPSALPECVTTQVGRYTRRAWTEERGGPPGPGQGLFASSLARSGGNGLDDGPGGVCTIHAHGVLLCGRGGTTGSERVGEPERRGEERGSRHERTRGATYGGRVRVCLLDDYL